MKTLILPISVVILLIAVIFFLLHEAGFQTGVSIFNRQGDMSNVAMKMGVVINEGRAYYFIVTNDATLITQVGPRRYHAATRATFNLRPSTGRFLRSINDTAEIKLTEQEFQFLLSLASELDTGGATNQRGLAFSNIIVVFFYNDVFYINRYASRREMEILNNLMQEFSRLSPIDVRFPW